MTYFDYILQIGDSEYFVDVEYYEADSEIWQITHKGKIFPYNELPDEIKNDIQKEFTKCLLNDKEDDCIS